MSVADRRRDVARARRLVVKVGSSSLTHAGGGSLDEARLVELVDVLAARRLAGQQVVLVSSGAIAAGIGPLGLARRPGDLATQQAAASVGQGALVAAYQRAFGAHGLTVGQVLLTADDVTRRSHYTNARRTLDRLLELGIVPIVNENDTVATQEIRFGDNDRLAALVAHLVHADGLLLLTDVDALYDGPPSLAGSRRVPSVVGGAGLDELVIGGTGSSIGSGGMLTKVEAATIANAAGITTVLTSSDRIAAALEGADVGTVFVPTGSKRTSRKLWLEHATTPRGRLLLDPGAVRAVTERRTSLLPAGITAVEGSFSDGDAVDLCTVEGRVIARGLVNYTSAELPGMLGRSTRELAKELGPEYEREVVHRDDLVLL
ncbi:gamma-glutamyl kinase [Phycicoccus sp. Root563]|uniref:glutamate 5-kinase n=1 Tax=unclassified Phycicoccus TaxID=2637926 RepID=UPI000703203E|nr:MULTISPECIES: glutamate 5-kinase [unclassified Phycicoccus]KQU70506.1 gamma-glutamyl kinase [Phycicoccus sp. Root101]KQZ88797.1 gamma-glutamyl kinase [Phycicoccus sp. Root563]